jgi:DNA primase
VGSVAVGPGFRLETRRYHCPVCGGNNLDATRKSPYSVLYHCWSCHANGADIYDALGLEMQRQIFYKAWPVPDELGPDIHRQAPFVSGDGDISVSDDHVEGWASALWSHSDPLGYLRETRGLSDETIRAYKLGYDSSRNAIVFPVYEDGELVYVKVRYLDPAANPKTRNSRGPSHLYPSLPPDGPVLLVAGELDALTGRQLGVPAVSTTCGATLPLHLAERFKRRRIYVLFDVGELSAAVKASDRLWKGDADYVRVVPWPPGLPKGTDLNDWVVKHGGTRRQLNDLITKQLKRTSA